MKPIEQISVLDKLDCEKLKKYFEDNRTEKYTKQSQYKNGGTHAIVDAENVPNNFFEKLKCFNIIPFQFQYNIDDNNSLVIHKYEMGDFFTAHSDTSLYIYGTGADFKRTKRIKTLLFQLSDTMDYDGGDFLVDGLVMGRNIGNCICFDSKLIHEVIPITRGVRYSMSLWVEIDNMSFSKKYI